MRRGPEPVRLSPKAVLLLALLVEARPRPRAQRELRDALWPDTHVGYTSLARVVAELRKAIGDSAHPPTMIRTVTRFGYAFAATSVVEQGAAGDGNCVLVTGDRELTLPEGETLLGRGRECGVPLRSTEVSRVHTHLPADDRHRDDHDAERRRRPGRGYGRLIGRHRPPRAPARPEQIKVPKLPRNTALLSPWD